MPVLLDVLHPTTLLILWGCFAVGLPFLSLNALLFCFSLCLGLFFFLKKSLWSALKQIRYLLIMLMIMHISTMILDDTMHLYSSLIQSLRLMNMIMSLHIILHILSKNEILLGLYYIFRPLTLVGINFDIFLIRLWLTLYYFENFLFASKEQKTLEIWQETYKTLMHAPPLSTKEIHLNVIKFHFLDKIIYLIIIFFIIFYIKYKII